MNPLEYWEMASRGGDPIDIKMCELALHYLTPPASSVDIERLFSTAADITTNDRNQSFGCVCHLKVVLLS